MISILVAALVFSVLAYALGSLLGYAQTAYAVQHAPIVQQIDDLLPQTQCAQCGYPGCRPYAEAIAKVQAPINLCLPGGQETEQAIAELLNVTAQTSSPLKTQKLPSVALIDEADCVGCTRCLPVCPVDAIIGASEQMHTVVSDYCTGCELCVTACPMDCIQMYTKEQIQHMLIREKTDAIIQTQSL